MSAHKGNCLIGIIFWRGSMSSKRSKQIVKNQKVTFTFNSDHAEEVFLMGDFNEWKPDTRPMDYVGNNTWQKSVMLSPGKHEYKFVVDGQWIEDANNEQSCPNRFGTRNSIIETPEE